MEQQKALSQQTYTHLLVQAHARSRMTASRKASMYEKLKTHTNPAGLDGTRKAFIEQTYTHLLVQAHARSRMTSARRHACMKIGKTQIHHQG